MFIWNIIKKPIHTTHLENNTFVLGFNYLLIKKLFLFFMMKALPSLTCLNSPLGSAAASANISILLTFFLHFLTSPPLQQLYHKLLHIVSISTLPFKVTLSLPFYLWFSTLRSHIIPNLAEESKANSRQRIETKTIK